jgi:hypothetical protein
MANSNDRQLKSLNVQNNCSAFQSTNFVIDSKTKLKDDVCNENGDIKQNNNINDYMLSNYSSCKCNLNDVLKTATNNNGVIIKDGYGVSECNVNKDSTLRQGQVDRHYKSDLQLFPRPYLSTPSTIRGQFKPNLESKLINAQLIKRHGQMQYFNQDNIFTPLVTNLQKNVQNTEHIIQAWVRGGIPSRDAVKYNDYMQRSTDSDIIKQLLQNKTKWFN